MPKLIADKVRKYICPKCGTIFYDWPSRRRYRPEPYCSQSCRCHAQQPWKTPRKAPDAAARLSKTQ